MTKNWRQARAVRLLRAGKISTREFDRRMYRLRDSDLDKNLIMCAVIFCLLTPYRYHSEIGDLPDHVMARIIKRLTLGSVQRIVVDHDGMARFVPIRISPATL